MSEESPGYGERGGCDECRRLVAQMVALNGGRPLPLGRACRCGELIPYGLGFACCYPERVGFEFTFRIGDGWVFVRRVGCDVMRARRVTEGGSLWAAFWLAVAGAATAEPVFHVKPYGDT